MRGVTLSVVILSTVTGALAQDNERANVKMLTPAECAQVDQRSDDELFVRGEIKIGDLTIGNSSFARAGIDIGGIDIFDVIKRSCFKGSPHNKGQ